MEKVDVAVIGAGVIGLAVAYEISRNQPEKSILVLEKNNKPGQEITSRNSQVIHAGIYYPANSLKTQLCIAGSAMLYEFCDKHSVSYRRLGKLIVAADEGENNQLKILYQQGIANGCILERLDRAMVKRIEPGIQAAAGILSPNTGIIDAETLVQTLSGLNRQQGVVQLFRTPVKSIRKLDESGYVLKTSQEEIETEIVINAAGLGSDKVVDMLGLDVDCCGYRLQYCKGEYYSLSARYKFDHLVYPVPSPHFLGIHLTQDLSGRQRLGPNAYYVNDIDYDIDEKYRDDFFTAARRYIPDLQINDIQPDYSGIRPKLQGPDQPFRDFVIKDERDLGFPGFINLIGIESPGLTSCLAIGRYVCEMLSEQV